MGTRSKLAAAALLGLCGATLWWAACATETEEVVRAEHPLSKVVVRSSGRILFYAAPDVNLGSLVDLAPLTAHGLWPGADLEDVKNLMGEPEYTSTAREGRDDVYGYVTPQGAIELVVQHVASEGTKVDRYFLRYRPASGISAIHPAIVSQLARIEVPLREVRVFAGPDHRSVAGLDFDGGSLDFIWWQG